MVTASGFTLILSFFVAFRSPPSSSYGRRWFRRTSMERPVVVCTNGDPSTSPTTERPSVLVHCHHPSAVTTPTSSRPSSGVASGNTERPPNTSPTLPTRTQVALSRNQAFPSTSIVILTASIRAFFAPVHTYARRPTLSFNPASASRIIIASSPTPVITAKRSPFTLPTSSVRRPPWRPIRTHSPRSLGSSRFVANRLAVPAGRTARVTGRPATASIAR